MEREVNWDEELCGLVADHCTELTLNHAAFCELVRLVDRQQECIERLEKIVVSMSGGSVSSYGDNDQTHTHWVYPLNGAMSLVQEIKDSLAPSRVTLTLTTNEAAVVAEAIGAAVFASDWTEQEIDVLRRVAAELTSQGTAA